MGTTFLGQGAMGSALAATTSAAGEPVTVWNRTAGRTRRMAGASAAETVAEAIAGSIIGGFLQGAAMLRTSATEFAARQAPFLAAMTDQLAGYAATVDARDYEGPDQQSLRFTATALAPVRELVRRQIDAGYGDHGTARAYESLRSLR
ncbi:NAD(P)-binding domain-containing protein [Cryptosporangium sp. NPDC048952]|uniref:NAD(P)-binding domain-containing protein n=1 Tax=Cryptosporangium sp. NPDC048952 TaxID=3363961 RepID=UPI00371E3D67